MHDVPIAGPADHGWFWLGLGLCDLGSGDLGLRDGCLHDELLGIRLEQDGGDSFLRGGLVQYLRHGSILDRLVGCLFRDGLVDDGLGHVPLGQPFQLLRDRLVRRGLFHLAGGSFLLGCLVERLRQHQVVRGALDRLLGGGVRHQRIDGGLVGGRVELLCRSLVVHGGVELLLRCLALGTRGRERCVRGRAWTFFEVFDLHQLSFGVGRGRRRRSPG